MNICLVTIGDELLEGVIRNGNSEWFLSELWSRGLSAREHVTVTDDMGQIAQTIERLTKTHDLCVLSGGLGPTSDDVTVAALAKTLGDALIIDDSQCEKLLKVGLTSARAQRQSLRPQSARALDNPVGYAPLIALKLNNCEVIALPGVPREFRSGVEKYVWPTLSAKLEFNAKTLSFINLGESRLSQVVDEAQLNDVVHVRYQADSPFTHLRLRSVDPTALAAATARVSKRLESFLIENTDDTLVERLAHLLNARSQMIGTAESCTAGLIASELGRLPGASAFLSGGIIAYSNDVKMRMLHVSPKTLEQYGAVSEACAAEMAKGVCTTLGIDVGVSVTGIAGPGGGTPSKPVGTVCFGWSICGDTQTETVHFRGKRSSIRQASAVWSLHRCLELLSARPK